MYEELIEELRRHHCDAKEDDTQEVCEECAYDVIIADKSVPSGIASVCVCGLMNRAADAIEELSKKYLASEVDNTNLTGWLAEEHAKHLWIPVTERLPEVRTWVLCFCRANSFDVFRMTDEGHWQYGNRSIYMKGYVTHWMPLPEPPKEE